MNPSSSYTPTPPSPPSPHNLFLNPLDTIPLPLQILLPQTNLIIPPANRQHIPAQTPAHPPQHSVEIQHGGFPVIGGGGVGGPYSDGLVLGGGGDVGFLEDGGGPGDVADPVGVAGEGGCWVVGLVGGAVAYLDQPQESPPTFPKHTYNPIS